MGYYVYEHVCRENGKIYVGITKQIPRARFGKDGYGYRTCSLFYNAIKKYGWDNFDHIILYSNLSREEAKAKEKELIAELHTDDDRFGYNIKPGGENETLPQQVKDKISKSHIGKPGTNSGKHFTEEHKQRISQAQKGRKMSDTHYENFLKAMNKRKGKPGRPLKPDERMRLAEQTRKKVKCVETGVIYNSHTEACKDLNIQAPNLSRAVDKPNVSVGGYHFVSVNTECVTTIENDRLVSE